MVMNTFYQWFLPFIISTINSLYIGFSHHQIITFINFLSLILLLFIALINFRLVCLSFFLSLIYSLGIIITFIFTLLTLDQSEILLGENYNFIPTAVFIILATTAYLAYGISADGLRPTCSREMYLPLLAVTILYGFIYLTKSSEVYSFIFTSGARQQTRKVNKDMSFVNNLILENHLSLLSLTLYTDTNAIVITLGLALFISLVNCFLILKYSP